MASAANQHYNFPVVPPSLSAGDHEMRDYYSAQDAPRPIMNQAPYLTPYLGLRARLSQIWINRWTILLFLVLVRVLIATADLKSNMDSARTEALSACTSVETAGSVMASMPHYMSQGVNELTAAGIDSAVDGLVSILKLMITGIEEIVLFYINMMTSTYVCLITAAVGSALHVSIEVVEDVSSGLNKTLDSIGDDISTVAEDFQDEVNKLIDGINSIPEIFGGKGMDKLNLTKQIDELKNIQLPSGLDEGLDKLNNSIPTFDQVHNLTNAAIRFPFEEVKGLINDHIGNFSVNRSLFPVPAKEKLTFCSDDNGINDFFDDLLHIEMLAKKIFIAVIVILAVAACVPMAWREIRRWKTMQLRAQLVGKSAYDPMDVVYIASRPYTSAFGISVANRFSSTRRQIAVRWAVAYATTMPALFVLSLGLAGLFACLCQYILLKSIEKEVPALTQQVGDFADKVVFALNNASEQWANGTNNVIVSTNNELNQNVFSWVNTSTTAVNNTLTVFVDEMTKVLNETFGGTVLYNPIMDVINCLILLKIKGIESGLTWVQDHAHIDFPVLPNDTFSLGAAALTSNDSGSFLASPDSSTEDAVTGAVSKLVNKLVEGIKMETIISTCVVMCWVVIALIGIIRACFIFHGQGKTRAEGGQAYVIDPVTDNSRGHDTAPNAPHVVPYVAPAVRSEDAAPPYEYVTKAAPYTIIPRPFPSFGSSSENPASDAGSNEDEKVGQVGASHPVNLAVSRPAHDRTSSHGQVARTTPVDEKNSLNPFI